MMKAAACQLLVGNMVTSVLIFPLVFFGQVCGALLRAEALRDKMLNQSNLSQDDDSMLQSHHIPPLGESVHDPVVSASRQREQELISLAESLRQDTVCTAQNALREREKLHERILEKERRLAIAQKEAVRKDRLIATLQNKLASLEDGWSIASSLIDSMECALRKIEECMLQQSVDVGDLAHELRSLAREAAKYRQRIETEKELQKRSTAAQSDDAGTEVDILSKACRDKDQEIERWKALEAASRTELETIKARAGGILKPKGLAGAAHQVQQLVEGDLAQETRRLEVQSVESQDEQAPATAAVREKQLQDLIHQLNEKNAELMAGREETESELQKIQEEVEMLKLTEMEWLNELHATDETRARKEDKLRQEIEELQRRCLEEETRAKGVQMETNQMREKMERMQHVAKMHGEELERLHMVCKLHEADAHSAKADCRRLQADLIDKDGEIELLRGLLEEAGNKLRTVSAHTRTGANVGASGQQLVLHAGEEDADTATRAQIADAQAARQQNDGNVSAELAGSVHNHVIPDGFSLVEFMETGSGRKRGMAQSQRERVDTAADPRHRSAAHMSGRSPHGYSLENPSTTRAHMHQVVPPHLHTYDQPHMHQGRNNSSRGGMTVLCYDTWMSSHNVCGDFFAEETSAEDAFAEQTAREDAWCMDAASTRTAVANFSFSFGRRRTSGSQHEREDILQSSLLSKSKESTARSASAKLDKVMQELRRLDSADDELSALGKSIISTAAALCAQLPKRSGHDGGSTPRLCSSSSVA
jgi:hypothetical protein